VLLARSAECMNAGLSVGMIIVSLRFTLVMVLIILSEVSINAVVC
jgi:hypothetical protein